MNKSQEKAKTLLEFMGFKDPDIHTKSHDEWVMKLSDKEIIIKLLKKLKGWDVRNVRVTIERILSDKYRKFGFLDVYFVFDVFRNKKHCNVFDYKSKEQWDNISKYNPGGGVNVMRRLDPNGIYVSSNQCFCGDDVYKDGKGFIEIKTGSPSMGSVIREMEYYKDCLHTNIQILLSNLDFPKSFEQFICLKFEDIQDVLD